MKTTKFSRIISLVLVFVMLSGMLVFDTGAKVTLDKDSEPLFTYVIEGEGEDKTVTILKCSDKATGKVVIPEKIDGFPVTKIDKNAFEGCSSITGLVIPQGVKVIGDTDEKLTFTNEDYLDLFVKRDLVYHLNFVGVKAGTEITGSSESYRDTDALASDRFGGAITSYWNQYIYDAVTDANGNEYNYISGGIPTVNAPWKFISPYIYSYWFEEDGSLAHKVPDYAVENFVAEEGLDEETLKGTYEGSSHQLSSEDSTIPVYDVIYEAPAGANGYYITGGIDGKVIYSSYMGDGYMRLNHAGWVGYMQANVDQLSGDYTVELALKQPASVRQDAYYMQCGTLVEPLVVTESNYLYLKSGADNYCMTGLSSQGIIKYTVTADRDAEGSGATVGFFVNGRNDFVAEDKATPVSSTKQVSDLSKNFWVQMLDPGVETYAIRVYDTVLTEAEILQNNFADIATVAQLDISEFLKLTETEKQDVYTAFKGVDASEAPSALQLKLDTLLGNRANQKYYDLYVQDDLVYHINFADATSDMTVASNDSYLPFVVDKKDGITNPWSKNGSGTFAFGDGYTSITGVDDNWTETFITFFNGGASLTGKTKASVEFVTAPLDKNAGTVAMVKTGPYWQVNYESAAIEHYQYGPGLVPSEKWDVYMRNATAPISGFNINTRAYVFDFYNAEEPTAFNLYAYANGYNYAGANGKAGVATSEGFSGAGTMYAPRNGKTFNIYAMRVYEKALSSIEVLQNHFADIALINQLDISKFVEASDEEKQAVYAAFESVSATASTDAEKQALQEKLDACFPEEVVYSYYDLFVSEGLLYHMNFDSAVASDDLLDSTAKYEPYVVARDTRVANPWWDGFSSNVGNGYLNFKNSANILSGVKENGGDINITGAKKVSVELVAEGAAAGRTLFCPGLDMEFHFSANNAQFLRTGAAMDPNSSFTAVTMGSPISGLNINTYSITYGFNDETDSKKYTLNMYGNGMNYRNKVITSDTEGFSGVGTLTLNAGALNVYAVRVYESELSRIQVLQNHFADIATIKKLNISEFVNASDIEKEYIYRAFEGVYANEANLQDKLDKALADARVYAKYYDLFVKDGLVYHINFAEATSDMSVASNASYLPFVVDKKDEISNPWSKNGSGTFAFGDGYTSITGVDDNWTKTFITFFNGGASLTGKTKVSIEFVTAPLDKSASTTAMLQTGPYWQVTYESAAIDHYQNGDGLVPNDNWNVYMRNAAAAPISGFNINTRAYVFDFYNAEDLKAFNLYAYANGYNYAGANGKAGVATSEGFSGAGTMFAPRNGKTFNIYAMRVYEKALSSNEVLQNHFADIALINQLDISKFVEASYEEKQAVYAAFESVSATASTDAEKQALQEKLDACFPEEEEVVYSYYDLFVQDGLIFHINLAEATVDSSYTGLGSFKDFVVDARDGITNPAWYGGSSNSFGDGYITLKGETDYFDSTIQNIFKEAAQGVSIELTMAPKSTEGNTKAFVVIGPYYNLTLNATNPYFGISQNNDMVLATGRYPTIEMGSTTVKVDGTKLNTYSLVYTNPVLAEGATNPTYTFTQYANGNLKGVVDGVMTAEGVTYYKSGTGLIQPHTGDGINLYAMRTYDKILSAEEVLQNNFADIVTIKGLELDVEKFIILSEDEKLSVYKAFEGLSASDDKATLQTALKTALKATSYYADAGMFADCDALTSITLLATSAPSLPANAFVGSSVKEIVVPASAVSAYEEAEVWSDFVGNIGSVTGDDVLTFKGYQARLKTTPGLRSTYSIDRTAIELLEADGYTVTVGAMMAAATNEKTAHEDLVVPVANDTYDRTGYGDEYLYINSGVAYQEIYRTDDKNNGKGGVVAALTSVTDTEYEFAFTTVYNSDNSQTVESFRDNALLFRGFVIVTKGAEQSILYIDTNSRTFDENGDSITMYELSKYIYDYGKDDINRNEMILLVVNKVGSIEE